MLRTICFKNPSPRMRQVISAVVRPGSRHRAETVRTVPRGPGGVPAFWKLLKSQVPGKTLAASSMAARSRGGTSQTKRRRSGFTWLRSSHRV